MTDEQRPCAYGDITILLPARTSLPMLEDALLDAGIPYQAENSSLVYATSEVRNLIMAVRCIADPTDELAVVNALRSTLFGCSDRDLYEWRQIGGRWSLVQHDGRPAARRHRGPPSSVGRWPSCGGWRRCSSGTPRARSCSAWSPTGGCFELALAHPTSRDVWRRLRFVIDQARAWSDAGGVGLRAYLDWVRRQGSEGRYQPEAVLPETDVKAVKIMTIHAAKGLQFPITVLSGLTTEPRTSNTAKVTWTANSWDLVSGDEYVGPASDRRAAGPPRTAPTALRRVHPRRRPPDRVALPQGRRARRRGARDVSPGARLGRRGRWGRRTGAGGRPRTSGDT